MSLFCPKFSATWPFSRVENTVLLLRPVHCCWCCYEMINSSFEGIRARYRFFSLVVGVVKSRIDGPKYIHYDVKRFNENKKKQTFSFCQKSSELWEKHIRITTTTTDFNICDHQSCILRVTQIATVKCTIGGLKYLNNGRYC